MMKDTDTVKLFWTGGWDSTFRLLQAVLLDHKRVQPYYLWDHKRRSSDMEKKTMDLIKQTLFSKRPDVKELVLPTIFFAVEDIGPSEDITESYKSIAARMHLGSQFDWLARFCFYQSIDQIELSIESGGTNQINRELMAKFKVGAAELDDKYSNTDVYTAFRYYRFPLITTTKLEMKKIAKENGFLDLLNMTWFCHSPINGLPCGKCNPCVAAMRDGLGSRIPLSGHIRYYRRISFEAIKGRLQTFPKIYRFLKNIKQNFLV
jgi:hypothetical protein